MHAPNSVFTPRIAFVPCRDVVPITELVEFDRGHARMKRKRLVDQMVSTGSAKT